MEHKISGHLVYMTDFWIVKSDCNMGGQLYENYLGCPTATDKTPTFVSSDYFQGRLNYDHRHQIEVLH